MGNDRLAARQSRMNHHHQTPPQPHLSLQQTTGETPLPPDQKTLSKSKHL